MWSYELMDKLEVAFKTKHLTDNCIKLLFISVGNWNMIEESIISIKNVQFIY